MGCKWDFKRIVPAHLKNNIAAGPSAFRRAFSFLTVEGEPAGQPKPRKDDLQTLLDDEKNLGRWARSRRSPGWCRRRTGLRSFLEQHIGVAGTSAHRGVSDINRK